MRGSAGQGTKRAREKGKKHSWRLMSMDRRVRNKEGKLLKSFDEDLERWKEHFEEVLNCPDPVDPLLFHHGQSWPLTWEASHEGVKGKIIHNLFSSVRGGRRFAVSSMYVSSKILLAYQRLNRCLQCWNQYGEVLLCHWRRNWGSLHLMWSQFYSMGQRLGGHKRPVKQAPSFC